MVYNIIWHVTPWFDKVESYFHKATCQLFFCFGLLQASSQVIFIIWTPSFQSAILTRKLEALAVLVSIDKIAQSWRKKKEHDQIRRRLQTLILHKLLIAVLEGDLPALFKIASILNTFSLIKRWYTGRYNFFKHETDSLTIYPSNPLSAFRGTLFGSASTSDKQITRGHFQVAGPAGSCWQCSRTNYLLIFRLFLDTYIIEWGYWFALLAGGQRKLSWSRQ